MSDSVLDSVEFYKDNIRLMTERFPMPKILSDILKNGTIKIETQEELDYMQASAITTADGKKYVCLTSDIVDWTVDPANIFVTKTDFTQLRQRSPIVEKWTPIRDIQDSEVKIFYTDSSLHEYWYDYAAAISVDESEKYYTFPSRWISTLGHFHIWSTPEYISRM